ncbi:MAG TPA: DUF2191 domain-containing protein [Methylomirabilota bacterium]|nr:DUF2191 domain-containing protein [Methylomirabilota bacterium]
MRTTLTLDDDVAALLKRVLARRKTSFRSLVNEALRQGLRGMTAPRGRPEPYRTPAKSLGRCLLGNVDDVAEVLAVAERESFR